MHLFCCASQPCSNQPPSKMSTPSICPPAPQPAGPPRPPPLLSPPQRRPPAQPAHGACVRSDRVAWPVRPAGNNEGSSSLINQGKVTQQHTRTSTCRCHWLPQSLHLQLHQFCHARPLPLLFASVLKPALHRPALFSSLAVACALHSASPAALQPPAAAPPAEWSAQPAAPRPAGCPAAQPPAGVPAAGRKRKA